jgi:molybdopterin molybdotransferase
MATVTFEQARGMVETKVRQARSLPDVESVPLGDAAGRILAEAIQPDRDYPPFPRATRDGYAMRAADTPGRLRIAGQVRAGAVFPGTVEGGEAIEIMTGAPVPAGADAVIMVEQTTRAADVVAIERHLKPGDNIVPPGSEASSASTVLAPGHRLRFPEIALTASFGRTSVSVYRRPRAAILSTGDEVVDIEKTPESFQIRNSNAASLAAQVSRAGGEPIVLPIAPDEPARTRELINLGLEADLLLISGGVSMGKYDLVEQVLADLGAEFFFDAVLIQPGKPLVFGGAPTAAGTRFFFGLPGNPLSTMVTFEIFARAALELIAGANDSPLRFFQVRLGADFRHKPGLTRFLPAALTGCRDEQVVNPVKWQGSGDVVSLTRSNALLVVSADREEWTAGEWMPVWPL